MNVLKMLAIQIKYKDSSEIIGVEHGLIMMNIISNENNAVLYAGTKDSDSKTRNVWYKYDELSQDDDIYIEIVETDTITEPRESVFNASIRPQLTKVDQFRQLEAALKEEGLI